jgi:hypothetical protein
MADNIFLGAKVSICATAQASTLNQAAYEGLTYVEVDPVVTPMSVSEEVSMVSQGYINRSRAVFQKAKYTGVSSELVVGYDSADAGQIAVFAASRASGKYAFKMEMTDGTATMTPTIVYFRALVGPRAQAGGADEDFVNHTYPIQITDDEPLWVLPEAI